MRDTAWRARSAGHALGRCIALAALLTAATTSGTAVAEEAGSAGDVVAASREYDQGVAAWNLKDYETAATHFERAFRHAPTVQALRLAMWSRQRAGHAARAATLAERALRMYGDDQDTAKAARELLDKESGKSVKVVLQCEPACAVVVDRRAVFDDPAEQSVFYVDPGRHQVVATWSGGRERPEPIEGKAGDSRELQFEAPPLAEPQVADGGTGEGDGGSTRLEPRGGISPVVTYVGLGLTAVLTGATIWSGVDTKNNPGKERVEAECINQGESCPLYQDALDRQRRTNILLAGTVGVAVVTGVIGIFLTDWSGDQADAAAQEPTARFQIRPNIGLDRTGMNLGAMGRF